MSNKKDYGTIRLAFGKKTKLGGWSNDLTLQDFETIQGLTLDQVQGARISHRTIKSVNKKTGEEFESLVYEILLPHKVKEFQSRDKKPLTSDDI